MPFAVALSSAESSVVQLLNLGSHAALNACRPTNSGALLTRSQKQSKTGSSHAPFSILLLLIVTSQAAVVRQSKSPPATHSWLPLTTWKCAEVLNVSSQQTESGSVTCLLCSIIATSCTFAQPRWRCRLHMSIDFVVCIGGDGVILHASYLFRRAIPPVRLAAYGCLAALGCFKLHGCAACWFEGSSYA